MKTQNKIKGTRKAWGSFIWYICKIFRKTNISHPLIRTCAYKGVRNVSCSETFAYVLNKINNKDNRPEKLH